MVSLQNAPFSASSSWNTPVSGGSTYSPLNWPGSTGYNYGVSWDTYSPSVYVASASDPVVQVSHPEGWGYPAGTVSVHMPAAADGAAGTDGELVVIDGDTAYNFWQFNRTSSTTATAASFGAENVVTGDGWGSKSPFLSAGITAVGASELAGLLVKSETNDGSIDHALQITVDSNLAKSGFMGNAISGDGGSSSGIVKEGQHLAIPQNTPMPSGLSPLGQQVFKALQNYGAYVVDVAGGTTNIRAQANSFDPSTISALYDDMAKITPKLEAVSSSNTSGGTGSTSGTGVASGTGSTGSTGTSGSDPTSGTGVTGSTGGTGTSTGSHSGGTGSTGGTGTSGSDPTSGTGATGSTGGTGTSAGSDPKGHGHHAGWGGHNHWGDHDRPGRHNGSVAHNRWEGHNGSVGHSGDEHSASVGQRTDFHFCGRGTLGFAADNHNAGGMSTADGAHTGLVALLNQYAAASFPQAGEALGSMLTRDHASANLAQVLARPHA